MIDRRSFLKTTSLAGATATSAVILPGFLTAANAQDVAMDELMKEGPLPEKFIGAEDAPATVIEYASMTCGHCANFHNNTYPELKEKYVETGKVKFVMREFPLDVVAMAAFMLARCTSDENYFPFIDLLFARQREWAFSNTPLDSLFAMAKQVGMSKATFDACLQNQELLTSINWVKDRGDKTFGVSSTPTFFIQGRRVRGAIGIDEFERQLRPFV